MFFPPVGGSNRLRTRNEVPRADGTTHHHRDSAGALELDTSSSRHGADWTAPAGDFVLRTTNLRSWIAADAKHLHHTILIKTANLVAEVQVTLTCRRV